MEQNNHLEELAKEYAEHEAAAAPHLARMEDIKKVFRADLDLGTHNLAGLKVSVARSSRLDTAKLEERYPVMSNPTFYKTTPNTTEVRRQLSPAEIAELSSHGELRVTIK